jgi:hypothetical protein
MSAAYKEDERALQQIIRRNVRCNEENDRINVIIYYKNSLTSNLIMNNNPIKKKCPLQQTNVLYEFSCPQEGCKLLNNIKYVGLTSTTLSRRLTMHLSSGAPKEHMQNVHNIKLTRLHLEDSTRVIQQYQDSVRLGIAEALLIQENKPELNRQHTGITRTIKLFGN